MSRRLALLILALMLACLACSLWLGGRRQPLPSLRLNPELPSLQGLLRRLSLPVAGKDLQFDPAASGLDCLLSGDQILVPVDQTCAFTLRADPRLTRRMRLALTGAATEVSYRLEQPEALRAEGRLRPGEEPAQLDVFGSEQRPIARLLLSGCQRPQPTAAPPQPTATSSKTTTATPQPTAAPPAPLPCFVEIIK